MNISKQIRNYARAINGFFHFKYLSQTSGYEFENIKLLENCGIGLSSQYKTLSMKMINYFSLQLSRIVVKALKVFKELLRDKKGK